MIIVQLVLPFVDVDLKYYNLGIMNRDATNDRVTVESAEATLKYGNMLISEQFIWITFSKDVLDQ